MLKGFTTILLKELKELMRDPKILIGMIILPLIMFPIMGIVFGYAVTSAQEQAQKLQQARQAKFFQSVPQRYQPEQLIMSYINKFKR